MVNDKLANRLLAICVGISVGLSSYIGFRRYQDLVDILQEQNANPISVVRQYDVRQYNNPEPFRAGQPLSRQESQKGSYGLWLPKPVAMDPDIEQRMQNFRGFDYKITPILDQDKNILGFQVYPLVYGAGNSCMNYDILALVGQESNGPAACRELRQ